MAATASTVLSVNVNKVALIRNSRGADFPNLLQYCRDIVAAGGQGITVHPRPDGRHVRFDDVRLLGRAVPDEMGVEFNVEGYPSPDFLELVLAVRPAQVTLVPDAPDALTSDAGWTPAALERLNMPDVLRQLHQAGIRSSLFVDTDPANMLACHAAGTRRVELYTGPYAHQYPANPSAALAPYIAAGQHAAQLGLELNAGHDLNLHNLTNFARQVPALREVSIGHALTVDCLYLGMAEAIRRYRACLA